MDTLIIDRNELTHSGRTVGEVLDHEESIRERLETAGHHRTTAGFEDLVCLVFSRDLLVSKMASAKLFTRTWDELSREIGDIDALLAPHGLI